jgi:hypothetical protein
LVFCIKKNLATLIGTCKDGSSVLGVYNVRIEKESETAAVPAADKRFAHAAESALLAATDGVQLTVHRQHGDVVFTCFNVKSVLFEVCLQEEVFANTPSNNLGNKIFFHTLFAEHVSSLGPML